MRHTDANPNPSSPVCPTALRVLRLLFELGHVDEATHVGALASRAGLPDASVSRYLLDLEHAGLARADRCRLTMAGLVVACRLPAVTQAPAGRDPQSAPPARQRQHQCRTLPSGFAWVGATCGQVGKGRRPRA